MKKKAKVFKKPRNLKMSKRSEKALDKVIIAWKGIRDGKIEFEEYTCWLGKLYKSCLRCPVGIKTKVRGCRNTPYYEYYQKYEYVSEPTRKRLAQAEIEFLQSCYY
jgi:hypothetical protein